MSADKNRRGAEIYLEAADETLLSDPRLDRFERFTDWLGGEIDLPQAEIIVECVDGNCLPAKAYNVPEDGAVGCFCIRLPEGFPRAWIVALALGGPGEDWAEQESRLVTLAHELLHVGEFYRRYGKTPGELADSDGAHAVVRTLWQEEGPEVEAQARALTDRFLAQDS